MSPYDSHAAAASAMAPSPDLTLTQAALLLRRSYRATLDIVLTGKIVGRQDPISGRWRVNRESVERLCSTR
jgi:hypothetical protein